MSTLEQILGMWPGAQESYDTIKQDASDLFQGNITPQLQSNMGQVLGALPLGKIAGKLGQAIPSMSAVAKGASSMLKGGAPKGPAPTLSDVIALAPKGAIPITPTHKMWPALIEDISGKVHSAGKPYGSGGIGQHDILATKVPQGIKATRGFVDPVSFNAFTEAMMEEIERAGKGFGLR